MGRFDHDRWRNDHEHRAAETGVVYDERGWHWHQPPARPRRADTITAAPDQDLTIVHVWNANDNPAAILAGSASLLRTVNHWNPDGSLNFPCQVGHHAGLKYNVVQLHHKWPVGLGGPDKDLKKEDCGWNMDHIGLGACGMHHDDIHLMWRLLGKALKPMDPFQLLPGMRRMFGTRVIEAVEQGWAQRIAWVEMEATDVGL